MDKPNFLEFLFKMTLNVKFNDTHYQYQPRLPQYAYLAQNWWFQPKSVTSYRGDKPNFLEFWVKMANMTLKVKVNEPQFQ